MADNDHTLFMELVQAATTMSTMAKKAGDVLDERFANMVSDPLHHLDAVLSKCPKPGFQWDGTLKEDDIEVEYILAPHQSGNAIPSGVRIRHRFFRDAVEYTQKGTREENEARARELLTERLVRNYPVQ